MSDGLNDDRREAVRTARDGGGAPFINGLDFLEVDPADETGLMVHFIFNLPDAPNQPVPPGKPSAALTKADVTIEGGERITDIIVLAVARTADNQLRVTVDRVGDFSVYTLRIHPTVAEAYDPELTAVNFVFHVECAKRFDCKPLNACPPEFIAAPAIDYLVKDYPGFVRIMLDRMSLLAPDWKERNPADLGVALVETLAYVADHLSYRQDVIATEAYLATSRLRTSVRRHARLVDYRLSEGANARAWIRLMMNADVPTGIPQIKTVPSGKAGVPDTLLRWRLATGFLGQTPPFLQRSTRAYQTALSQGVEFFEPMADTTPLYAAHNQMPLYNWSAKNACLPVGATAATLAGSFPNLRPGMVLVLAEILGPLTGSADDADTARRWPVRLIKAGPPGVDPVTQAPVTAIAWHAGDALPFTLCLSSITEKSHGERAITGVSAAWGNCVLADHGRSLGDPLETMPEVLESVSLRSGQAYRPALAVTNLTFAAVYPFADDPPPGSAPLRSAADAAAFAASDAAPVITLTSLDADGTAQDWNAAADLLAIDILPSTADFVVEVETNGTATLRFGDGVHGLKPEPGARFTLSYRVGLGARGNVGRDSLTLIDTTGMAPAVAAAIDGVSNPLPAFGGVEPESLGHAKLSAPYAFRTQARAVTPEDYRDVALRFAGVRQAAATLRWTGSWHTVFLTIEREAGARLDPDFKARLEAYVDGYRMAGYDLEVEDALLTPLLVAMHVCVKDGYVAADIAQVIASVFSDQMLADGQKGVFHPDNLNLGQSLYLSPLYARAQAIDGVASVVISRFERESRPGDPAGLIKGVLTPNRLERFALANNANFPEHGQFELTVDGGL